jgi:RsiW-degrading membrane proteinase PrsW (M82 family)
MEDLLGLFLSVFFGFVPMFFFAYLVYWTDRYEKEPLLLLGGVFLWGAVIAAGAAFIVNTLLGLGVYLFTSSEFATNLTTGSVIAPFVEETLKGLAVLMVFLAFRKEFDTLLDGIVYAAIVALGFAATENVYYIWSYGYQEGGLQGTFFLVFVRVILVGWQHPFYTAFIGIGLAASRLSRNLLVKIGAPLAGYLAALFTHAMHNTLASILPGALSLTLGTLLDWSGWFLMFLFIIWAIYREKRWIVDQLREEVSLQVITVAHYRTACSSWAQTAARIGALFSGRYLPTSRFYQVCAELAYKKHQMATLGDEGGNASTIAALRSELARLTPRAQT